MRSRSPRKTAQARRRSAWLTFLFFVLICVICYSKIGANNSRTSANGFLREPLCGAECVPSGGDRKLVVLLPTDGSSPDLCKVIASMTVLGYPTPVIVNWNEGFDVSAHANMPSHLRKITGIREFLEWATSEDNTDESSRLGEDDLVLALDAHDVWMQLPPSVLLQRYFSLNHRANRDLREKFHNHLDYANNPPEQSIVISAQKRCYGPHNRFSDLHCFQVPESPLPENLYGFFTDSVLMGPKHFRPRWVNSGSLMGPTGDMLEYFRGVEDRMYEYLPLVKAEDDLTGDQALFGEIYGEQEMWRQEALVSQQQQQQPVAELDDPFIKSSTITMQEATEYHLGLDYAQELFYPTCHSESGGSFVRLHDRGEVEDKSSRAGVTPPRIQELPGDILDAAHPFSFFSALEEEEDPTIRSFISWGDVPLYTDFWTASIPVSIHHNAFKDGLKSRQRTWWDHTWFFPYLRVVLHARLLDSNATTGPIATLDTESGSMMDVLPYQARKGAESAILFGRRRRESISRRLWSADWNTVCRSRNESLEEREPWFDEVFRDGKGVL